MDKCQYDDDAEEWIIPYLKTSSDVELKLPGIGSARRDDDAVPRHHTSTRSRPSSGAETSDGKQYLRPNSKEHVYEHKDGMSNGGNVSSFSLPPHAPSKPPMPKSARRDKKKSRPALEAAQDMVSY